MSARHILDHPAYPINVRTCEDLRGPRPVHPLVPKNAESPKLFGLHDPFGLRKAIVPMFYAEPTDLLTGVGTAFALDSWGNFLTADHVVDLMRRLATAQSKSGTSYGLPEEEHMVALLGFGLVFGSVGLPSEALSPITRIFTPGQTVENPMAVLAGGVDEQRPWDIAFLTSASSPPEGMIANLPIRSYPPSPAIGDLVVAIGFPEIQAIRDDPLSASVTLSEGMYGAYGIVTALHPTGRDRANITPVFEVAGHWPSGMSGGPVFNAGGEVIGLVSRSLEPADADDTGLAWATWLAAAPQEHWPSSVDTGDAHWRNGWLAYRADPWTVVAFGPDEDAVRAAAQAAGKGFDIKRASRALGPDELFSIDGS
jgi:serine protease Do